MVMHDETLAAPGPPVPPRSDRRVASLLSDLANQIGTLVRQEVALFKAELLEKLGMIGRGAGAIAAGALIALSGWLALVAAAILGLAIVLAPWLAALIVGFVLIGIGGAVLYFGKSRFDSDALAMRRTLGSLREDESWVREQLS
jgi:Putative Actinobacterial Holin-X, holin superfamily III